MAITELVLVVSCVINILLLVLVFLNYKEILTTRSSIKESHVVLLATLSKVQNLEHLSNKIGTTLSEFINLTGNVVDRLETMIDNSRSKHFYKTSDGRYTATSLEELMNKIKDSDDGSKYFSDDELDKLRDMFGDEGDDDLEDDDDSFLK